MHWPAMTFNYYTYLTVFRCLLYSAHASRIFNYQLVLSRLVSPSPSHIELWRTDVTMNGIFFFRNPKKPIFRKIPYIHYGAPPISLQVQLLNKSKFATLFTCLAGFGFLLLLYLGRTTFFSSSSYAVGSWDVDWNVSNSIYVPILSVYAMPVITSGRQTRNSQRNNQRSWKRRRRRMF